MGHPTHPEDPLDVVDGIGLFAKFDGPLAGGLTAAFRSHLVGMHGNHITTLYWPFRPVKPRSQLQEGRFAPCKMPKTTSRMRKLD